MKLSFIILWIINKKKMLQCRSLIVLKNYIINIKYNKKNNKFDTI